MKVFEAIKLPIHAGFKHPTGSQLATLIANRFPHFTIGFELEVASTIKHHRNLLDQLMIDSNEDDDQAIDVAAIDAVVCEDLMNEYSKAFDEKIVEDSTLYTKTSFTTDGSIEPSGYEIVSKVFHDYKEAMEWLKTRLEWIENLENYTVNYTTGLHINIGTITNITKFNPLKMLVLCNDKKALQAFGRTNNKNTSNIADQLDRELLQSGQKNIKTIDGLSDFEYEINGELINRDVKYSFANFQKFKAKGFVEFRALGGNLYSDYRMVEKFINRFTMAMIAGMDENYMRREYLIQLFKLIDGEKENKITQTTIKSVREYGEKLITAMNYSYIYQNAPGATQARNLVLQYSSRTSVPQYNVTYQTITGLSKFLHTLEQEGIAIHKEVLSLMKQFVYALVSQYKPEEIIGQKQHRLLQEAVDMVQKRKK